MVFLYRQDKEVSKQRKKGFSLTPTSGIAVFENVKKLNTLSRKTSKNLTPAYLCICRRSSHSF